MRVILQPSLRGLSGKMGDWVYRYSKGRKKTFIGEKPVRTAEQTEEQLLQQERFREASQYAGAAMEDPALRELYASLAEGTDMSPQNAAVADFLIVPSFKPLDLSNYQGQVGDAIVIRAAARFGLASVQVTINREDGSEVEKGQAVEIAANKWIYTTLQPAALGAEITVEAVGACHTGKQVKMTEAVVVGAEA